MWRWQVGGRTASGMVPRAQLVGCMRAKRSAALPVTPTAAAAWPASGLGSGPGCSLRCTGSSSGRGPGPPASRSGRVGAGRTLRHPPLLQKFKPDGGGVAGRPHTSPLSYPSAGLGWQVLPASFPSPGLASMPPGQAGDKDPGLSVCPTRQPGPAAAPWAKLGWKHSASLGCQLPVPSRGMRCWRPHDSSPGQCARPRAGGPHPAQHLRAARKHM